MKTISILAFLIFLIPFVGFPSFYEDIFLLILSAFIIIKSFTIHLKLKKILPLLKKEEDISKSFDETGNTDSKAEEVFEDSTKDYEIEDFKKDSGY